MFCLCTVSDSLVIDISQFLILVIMVHTQFSKYSCRGIMCDCLKSIASLTVVLGEPYDGYKII